MQIKIGSSITQLASLAFIAAAAISSQASAATVQNHAPMISGSPTSVVTAGTMYTFQPNASDADGNSLVFSVTSKPAWARLDRATGRFYGTPTNAQAGSYEEIEITVSDGMSRTKLPKFTITVNSDAKLGQAPSISGTPATTATANKPYSFQPTAMDMDGDALTFSITGRPAWATLDKKTGRLSGTPTQAGTFTGIEISVSDGITRTQLPKFAVTVNPAAVVATTRSVTVNWLPPTANTDGTALTNLSGYRILYGTKPGEYTQSVSVVTVGLTSYTVENLPAGKYYFSMTATSSAGVESAPSTEMALDLT
jgi:hypothetical protein